MIEAKKYTLENVLLHESKFGDALKSTASNFTRLNVNEVSMEHKLLLKMIAYV